MGSYNRPDDVEGVLDVGDPVADCLVDRILQGSRPGLDWPDFGAEKLHAEHVWRLAVDILLAHVDDALQA